MEVSKERKTGGRERGREKEREANLVRVTVAIMKHHDLKQLMEGSM